MRADGYAADRHRPADDEGDEELLKSAERAAAALPDLPEADRTAPAKKLTRST